MQEDSRAWEAIEDRQTMTSLFPLNIPNSLTILRIFLIPVLVGFLVYAHYSYALVTLLIAALTDGLDGTIARLANQRTQFGAYLDPLADKLLLMSAFVTFAILDLAPVWSVILVVSRDAILLTGTLLARLTETRVDVSPTLLGKVTTFFQLLYIILTLVLASRQIDPAFLYPLLYLMSALTVISGLYYIIRGVKQSSFP